MKDSSKPFYIKALEVILIVFMAVIATNTALNVFCRFVLNNSLGWSDELAGYLLVWTMLIGAVLALKENGHIRFSAVVYRFHPRLQYICELISLLLMGFFLVIFTYYGAVLVVGTWDGRAISFNVSKSIIFFILPSSGFMMLTIIVGHFIEAVRNLIKNGVS